MKIPEMIHSRKTRYLVTIISIMVVLNGFFSACSSSSSSHDPAPIDNTPLENLFWLEPKNQTVIGVNQNINIFVALKAHASDAFPSYVDPAQVAFTSTVPAVAAINTSGVVVGLSEGTTVITAKYLDYSSEVLIEVSGTMINKSITVTGQGTRTYSIYVPNFTDSNPHPVLLSLHGGGGKAMLQAASSQLNKLANSRKFYTVYPDGSGTIQTFNGGACCGTAQTNNIKDVFFIRKVLDDVQAHYSVNTAKIFATGFSNGGIMSHRLACELADRISGVAPVSGGSGEFDFNSNRYYTCAPVKPIPILHIHATNDRNYPILGGLGTGLSATPFYGIQSSINDWLVRNNLTTQMTTEALTSTTQCYKYNTTANTSKPSAPVTLCVVDPVDVYDSVNEIVFGGGHSWPGGVKSPSANSDVPVADFDASTYIGNFLGL